MEVTSHIPFHIALARMRKLRSEVRGPIESNLAIRAAYFVGNDARLDDMISTVNGYIVEGLLPNTALLEMMSSRGSPSNAALPVFKNALVRMRKLRSEVREPIHPNLAIRAAHFVDNDARLDDMISTLNGFIDEGLRPNTALLEMMPFGGLPPSAQSPIGMSHSQPNPSSTSISTSHSQNVSSSGPSSGPGLIVNY